jgi:hypothetical protein
MIVRYCDFGFLAVFNECSLICTLVYHFMTKTLQFGIDHVMSHNCLCVLSKV